MLLLDNYEILFGINNKFTNFELFANNFLYYFLEIQKRSKVNEAIKNGKYIFCKTPIGYNRTGFDSIEKMEYAGGLQKLLKAYISWKIDEAKLYDECIKYMFIDYKGKANKSYSKELLFSNFTANALVAKPYYYNKVYAGKYKPIIDGYIYKEFLKKIKKLGIGVKIPKKQNNFFMMTRLECGVCGNKLTYKTKKAANKKDIIHSLACNNPKCENQTTYYQYMFKYIDTLLKNYKPDSEKIIKIIESFKKITGEFILKKDLYLEDIQGKIQAQQSRVESLNSIKHLLAQQDSWEFLHTLEDFFSLDQESFKKQINFLQNQLFLIITSPESFYLDSNYKDFVVFLLAGDVMKFSGKTNVKTNTLI